MFRASRREPGPARSDGQGWPAAGWATDGGEITDKRYVNQWQVLIGRSTLVELLYAQPTPADVIVAGTAGRTA